jgi:hypothetical protein
MHLKIDKDPIAAKNPLNPNLKANRFLEQFENKDIKSSTLLLFAHTLQINTTCHPLRN